MRQLYFITRSLILLFCVLGVLADLFARVALNRFQFVHEAVMYSLLSVPESAARFVFALECTLLAIICISQARVLWRRGAGRRSIDLAARGRLFVGLLFITVSGSLALTLGNPIASVGLFSPGSAASRALILDVAPWIRSWIEPGYWAFVVALLVLRTTPVDGFRLVRWRQLIISLLLLVTLESVLQHPQVIDRRESLGYSLLPLIHFLITQLFLGCWLAIIESDETTNQQSASIPILGDFARLLFVAITLSGGSFVVSWITAEKLARTASVNAGAHYYSWFPENWGHGYIGQKVIPPYGPLLGEYKSAFSQVLSRHISLAKEAGLSFFIFDWWSERPNIGIRLRRNIPKIQWENFRFAIQYETLDLKSKAASPVPYEDQNTIVLTRERTAAMQMHWEHIVKRFASHPSYLTVGNKPVIFVYATRHVLGEVSRRVTQARLHVKAVTGKEVFLVADEAFFNVLTTGRTKALMRSEGDPEWSRIIAFDAITAYNPYDSMRREHAGEAGALHFIDDVSRIYARYRAIAATAGERFIPGVLPGYNDRGVRLGAGHFVIPRTFDDGTSFFVLMLRRAGLSLMDRFVPMITVTSWNEWNEGTNIEPATVTEPSTEDESEGAGFYTQGEMHRGAGCREVEELSTELNSWKPR